MPLPWKKARISQFVADHLHSPKRGGSLVVETGFPTSLVDLFVKNRDRLKKPSKKKQSTAHDQRNPPQLPPPPPPPSNHSSSNISSSSNLNISLSSYGLTSESANQIDDKIVERDVVPIIKQSKNVMGEKTAIETPDANRVLVSVLKVFFIVVLALGTKRFVVGITLSAFLLFFLEYVGKYVYRLFQPCSNAHKILKFLFVRTKRNELEREISCSMALVEREESIISDSCSIEGPDLDAPTAETLIVQPNCNSVPPIEQIRVTEGKSNGRLGFEGLESKKGVMEREEDDLCEDSKVKHKHSRRARMKSKMKKLVPKKFRSSRKKPLDSKSEVDCPMEEEQEQHKDAEQCELECLEKSSTESSGSYDGEEYIVDPSIRSSGELSRGDSKAIVEEMGRETEGNSGYWVLCLIVLAGLVGGRILALVLTLCWCLMLKSGGTLRRYMKVPMLRTPVEFSN